VLRDLAFLAMALFKLGRIDEAQLTFERLVEVMNDPEEGWRYDDDVSTALFEECKQLLEGSNAQPKPAENTEERENSQRAP